MFHTACFTLHTLDWALTFKVVPVDLQPLRYWSVTTAELRLHQKYGSSQSRNVQNALSYNWACVSEQFL